MKLKTLRHSLAHILAAAVQELYPNVKLGIGPAIENGFYYDFDLPRSLAPEDLPNIEKKMKELIKKDIKFEKKLIPKKDAKKIFKAQPYKLELIKELPGKTVSIYQSRDFVDLCKGPHVKSSGEIDPQAFKLTKIAGAYWRGNEQNPMLTRIYGVAFETKKKLNQYLKNLEEAERRDHRVLGKKLELFIFDEEIGAGLPIWLPKGETLRHIIEEYLYQELIFQGYQWVRSSHIAKLELWKTSGHWNFYRENMYSPIEIDKEKYLLKPMNCPFHIKIYQSKIRSYKDLPLKFAELGTVYRYEKSGVLYGLVRVRGFTQDDAHIWCRPKQLGKELIQLLDQTINILNSFGFKDYEIDLSLKNPKAESKYLGSRKNWNRAEKSLIYVLNQKKLKYNKVPGEAVFYGPKIDIKIKDSLGRAWQCTTIQVDFNEPERFNITYIDNKGKKQRPIMIHRALIGSLERFIGVLLEHYEGALPLWLSPEQVWVIPVGSDHRKYAQEIAEKFKSEGLRVEAKTEAETVSKKIREGEIQKIPYLLVVGEKELKKKNVRVRERGKGDIGQVSLTKFLKKVKMEIESKK